jgi:hypothetical protein
MTTRFPLLSCVCEADLAGLRALLDQAGFLLLEIDGAEVRDARSFFAQAKRTLPLDPPLEGTVNWDAFSDSLWQGIDNLSTPRMALLWTAVHNMLERGLTDLLAAADALSSVARSVRDPSSGIDRPTDVLLFFVGQGTNFRSLTAQDQDTLQSGDTLPISPRENRKA